jgi:hypothetical protein
MSSPHPFGIFAGGEAAAMLAVPSESGRRPYSSISRGNVASCSWSMRPRATPSSHTAKAEARRSARTSFSRSKNRATGIPDRKR